MRLTKRTTAVAAGVVAAGGLVFGAASAFAAPGGSPPAAVSAAAAVGAGHHGGPLRKLRRGLGRNASELLARGAHGQETVKNAAGVWVEREWQSGTVDSVSGDAVTVTDGSGATWTWTLSSKTKIRVGGAAGPLSAVKAGDAVLLAGVRSGSANAAQVLDDPGRSPASTPAPETSATPGTAD